MKTTLIPGTTPVTKRDDLIISILIEQAGSEVFKDDNLTLTLEPQFVPQALIDLMSTMTLNETAIFKMEADYFSTHFTEHIPPLQSKEEVSATVTIKEVSKVEDLFSNGGFYLRIMEKTQEKKPNHATRAKIHYKFEIKDMNYIENLEQVPMQVMLNSPKVPELWRIVINKLNPGEHARVECLLEGEQSTLLDNGEDSRLNISAFKPQDAVTGFLYIKAESFDTGLYTEGLSSSERNHLALSLKDQGNSLFKSGDIEQAIGPYKSALDTLEPHIDDPSVLKPSCAVVLGNLSLCYLRLKDFAACEKFASAALDLTPSDPKFLLRRAQAKIGNSKLDSALEDLKTAQSLAPEGELLNSIKKEINSIKQEFAKIHQAEKSRYKNLFK